MRQALPESVMHTEEEIVDKLASLIEMLIENKQTCARKKCKPCGCRKGKSVNSKRPSTKNKAKKVTNEHNFTIQNSLSDYDDLTRPIFETQKLEQTGELPTSLNCTNNLATTPELQEIEEIDVASQLNAHSNLVTPILQIQETYQVDAATNALNVFPNLVIPIPELSQTEQSDINFLQNFMLPMPEIFLSPTDLISSHVIDSEKIVSEITAFDTNNAEIIVDSISTKTTESINVDLSRTKKREYTPTRVIGPDGRKRFRNSTRARHGLAKEARARGEAYVNVKGKAMPGRRLREPCAPTCRLNCSKRLETQVRESLFRDFWALADHQAQWEYIVKNVEIENKRLKRDESRRMITRIYKFQVYGKPEQVCQTMFCNTLGISDAWIRTACKKLREDGFISEDGRGRIGHRRKKSC